MKLILEENDKPLVLKSRIIRESGQQITMRFVWIALFLSLFEQIISPKNSTPSNTYTSKSTRSKPPIVGKAVQSGRTFLVVSEGGGVTYPRNQFLVFLARKRGPLVTWWPQKIPPRLYRFVQSLNKGCFLRMLMLTDKSNHFTEKPVFQQII